MVEVNDLSPNSGNNNNNNNKSVLEDEPCKVFITRALRKPGPAAQPNRSNEEVTCLIWDPQTAFRIRTKYRITGDLLGTLPTFTQQNQVCCLPLVLSKEEVTLGLERGFIELYELKEDQIPPETSTARNTLPSPVVQEADQAAATATADVTSAPPATATATVAAEQKKKRKRNETEEDAFICIPASSLFPYKATITPPPPITTIVHNNTNGNNDNSTTTAATAAAATASSSSSSSSTCSINNNNNNDDSNNNAPIINSQVTPEEAARNFAAGARRVDRTEWMNSISPLSTRQERDRYRVFVDLWERQYYITSAAKFGGEFMVYPGDPLRFHAHFIVHLVDWCSEGITPLDLISAGRIGNIVKKSAVLAAVDPKTNKPAYLTIDWFNPNI